MSDRDQIEALSMNGFVAGVAWLQHDDRLRLARRMPHFLRRWWIMRAANKYASHAMDRIAIADLTGDHTASKPDLDIVIAFQ